MYLDSFHSCTQNSHSKTIYITPEQGSAFAKNISDDFNPLHNPDSKRFCVPGDLLFALTLAYQGLSQSMSFHYTGMIGKNMAVTLPQTNQNQFNIIDENNKSCLQVKRHGLITHNPNLIETFSKAYVAFSGHCFPHVLVPLMKQHNVMINPARPMVIYESMAFEFQHLDFDAPTLELSNSHLQVTDKRGLARIEFHVLNHGDPVGSGYKTMVLGGLREYNQASIDEMVQRYEDSKKAYKT